MVTVNMSSDHVYYDDYQINGRNKKGNYTILLFRECMHQPLQPISLQCNYISYHKMVNSECKIVSFAYIPISRRVRAAYSIYIQT